MVEGEYLSLPQAWLGKSEFECVGVKQIGANQHNDRRSAVIAFFVEKQEEVFLMSI